MFEEHQLPGTVYPVPRSLQEARCVFKGVRFDVCTLEVNKGTSRSFRRDVVLHPGAVVILPILDEQNIVLIRNKRFAVGDTLLELPAGTLELGEPPLDTAKREIIEEIGYQAEEVVPLFQFYPTPGFCTEKMYAFVARKLKHVGQQLEETEEITVQVTRWDEALSMIRDGTIRDGKTIATLLYYTQYNRVA